MSSTPPQIIQHMKGQENVIHSGAKTIHRHPGTLTEGMIVGTARGPIVTVISQTEPAASGYLTDLRRGGAVGAEASFAVVSHVSCKASDRQAPWPAGALVGHSTAGSGQVETRVF